MIALLHRASAAMSDLALQRLMEHNGCIDRKQVGRDSRLEGKLNRNGYLHLVKDLIRLRYNAGG